MLLEIAVGDAYGAGFEYVSSELVLRHNHAMGYFQHPRHVTRPGQYTDDTQMSLAIAEAIVAGDEWTPECLASRFVDVFKRDPREGYSKRFFEFLNSVSSAREFLERIAPLSDKSGAAMRSVPIGVLASEEEVVYKSRVQAGITHNTEDGTNAAIAVALMSHYCLYRLGPKSEIDIYLEGRVRGNWRAPWTNKVGEKGWMSVRAAITALQSCNRLSDLLKTCIAYTGDVDTVAAIALGIGSTCSEIKRDVPEVLIAGLENGTYGRTYIGLLDRQLLQHVPVMYGAI